MLKTCHPSCFVTSPEPLPLVGPMLWQLQDVLEDGGVGSPKDWLGGDGHMVLQVCWDLEWITRTAIVDHLHTAEDGSSRKVGWLKGLLGVEGSPAFHRPFRQSLTHRPA
jgi:hypothetical protein